jgi:Resolvase, N terminal domain/Helix-turn-helix domain of resolvase
MARSISTYCGEPREEYGYGFFKIPHSLQFAQDLCAAKAKQIWGCPYPVALGAPWADTTTPHGRLMLTVLGGLAEFERHLILSRTAEGRQRAKARGVRFGRRPKLTKHQQSEVLGRIAQGETLVAIARSYNVSHMTISRLAGVTFMQ